jgi:xanthine dehydrogenase accessory factor
MSWIERAVEEVAEHGAIVRVTVIRADGSTPRESGAAMLVGAAHIRDTIGGGALELEAITHARGLLADAAASSPSPRASPTSPPTITARGEGRGEGRRQTPTPEQVAAPHPNPLPMPEEAWGEGTRAAPGAAPWRRDVRDFALGPSLGQCCGGQTRLLFEVLTTRERPCLETLARAADANTALVLRPLESGRPLEAVSSRKQRGEWPLAVARALRDVLSGARPREAMLIRGTKAESAWFVEPLMRLMTPLYVYGAGHVGRALVHVLQDLPFAVTWADTSASRFPDPLPPHTRAEATPDLPALASAAPDGAYHIVMTYSHALDLAICHAVLRRGGFGHLGLIGSATKRARFLKRLTELGIAPPLLARLACPIGLPGLGGKEPGMIAVAVAAHLVQLATASREQAAGAETLGPGSARAGRPARSGRDDR